MTLFYASNGSTVELLANRLHVNGATLGELSVEALREFFQAEQDKRNGVWREQQPVPLVAKPLALVYQVMYDLSKSTEKGGTKWEHQF